MGKFEKLYNLIFEQPAEAEITVKKPAKPTPEEINLFKRLHNSTYNPKSTLDQQNLAHLRKAGAMLGGYKDFKKLVPTAYALQYANSDQGNAYKNRAERLGVKFNEPQGPVQRMIGGNNNQPAAQFDATGTATPVPKATSVQPSTSSSQATPAKTPVTSPAPSPTPQPDLTSQSKQDDNNNRWIPDFLEKPLRKYWQGISGDTTTPSAGSATTQPKQSNDPAINALQAQAEKFQAQAEKARQAGDINRAERLEKASNTYKMYFDKAVEFAGTKQSKQTDSQSD